MAEFKSNLKDRLNEFISFKRSVGKKYVNAEYYISYLDQVNLELGNYDYLTKEVLEIAVNTLASRFVTPGKNFYSIFRELGKYLNIIDGKSCLLADKYKPKKYRANVYLFSNEEISR